MKIKLIMTAQHSMFLFSSVNCSIFSCCSFVILCESEIIFSPVLQMTLRLSFIRKSTSYIGLCSKQPAWVGTDQLFASYEWHSVCFLVCLFVWFYWHFRQTGVILYTCSGLFVFTRSTSGFLFFLIPVSVVIGIVICIVVAHKQILFVAQDPY